MCRDALADCVTFFQTILQKSMLQIIDSVAVSELTSESE
jgi:hypothetical protein